jgi:hypothetical protein
MWWKKKKKPSIEDLNESMKMVADAALNAGLFEREDGEQFQIHNNGYHSYFTMRRPAAWAKVVAYLKKYNTMTNCIYLPVCDEHFASVNLDDYNEYIVRVQTLYDSIKHGYLHVLAFLYNGIIEVEYRLAIGCPNDSDGFGMENGEWRMENEQ